MARFILDVANCDPKKVEKVLYDLIDTTFLGKEVARIICIDETNDAQFNDDERDQITPKQMENHLHELKLLG